MYILEYNYFYKVEIVFFGMKGKVDRHSVDVRGSVEEVDDYLYILTKEADDVFSVAHRSESFSVDYFGTATYAKPGGDEFYVFKKTGTDAPEPYSHIGDLKITSDRNHKLEEEVRDYINYFSLRACRGFFMDRTEAEGRLVPVERSGI